MNQRNNTINIIGAGLAGCEAAYQASKRGAQVNLYDIKPNGKSPAHKSDMFAELVCSNSLRAAGIENAPGLLKEEMRIMDSLIIRAADYSRVPAGGALAVDRDKFSKYITESIKMNSGINVINECVEKVPYEGVWIIATGPLTVGGLNNYIAEILGEKSLYFYDAAAPIVSADTIDMNIAYIADRYDKGDGDYINCPMNKEQYLEFRKLLIEAERAPLHEFEKAVHFEGCMPIEVLASRGEETMRFGPLKPVGLTNTHTGTHDYAVVQLRKENKEGSMYNIVGFQTNLKFGEQKRVFSKIPGLENAEFVRYGVMHRNTFIASPGKLTHGYMLKRRPGLFFAGQITGVEGYIESTVSGLIAGINAVMFINGFREIVPSPRTMTGALANYVSSYSGNDFQPLKSNFGIVDTADIPKIKNEIKSERYKRISAYALEEIKEYILHTFS